MAEYEAYKDSGAVWIGKIPAEWTVTRLKNHLRRTDARNPGGVQVLSLYRELGIVPKDSREDNHNVTSEDTSNYKYVQPGDFVVNKMKAWQGSVAVSDYEGIVSPAYYVYKFLDNSFYKRYFHYLIRSCYKEEFMSLSAGIRIGQWDLSSQDLDNVPVLIPTMTEQVKIAEYLDRETERIDAIIAEAKASIEEYKAWKASIIYETVTKGLDHDTELKESGVEWIGMIPKHWNTRTVGSIAEVTKLAGFEFSEYFEYIEDGAVIAIRGLNLKNIEIDISNVQRIAEDVSDKLPRSKIITGDILVSYAGTVGSIGVVRDEIHRYHLAPNVGKITLHDRNNCPIYLAYYLSSKAGQQEIDLRKNKNAQESISMANIRKLLITTPPLDEQERIAEYLDVKCHKVDDIVCERTRLIMDLEVYKKSLIFEVVTGKRKVV